MVDWDWEGEERARGSVRKRGGERDGEARRLSRKKTRGLGAATSPLSINVIECLPLPSLFPLLPLSLSDSSPEDLMMAASFSRRSWSETAGGTAASGEAGL